MPYKKISSPTRLIARTVVQRKCERFGRNQYSANRGCSKRVVLVYNTVFKTILCPSSSSSTPPQCPTPLTASRIHSVIRFIPSIRDSTQPTDHPLHIYTTNHPSPTPFHRPHSPHYVCHHNNPNLYPRYCEQHRNQIRQDARGCVQNGAGRKRERGREGERESRWGRLGNAAQCGSVLSI